MEIIEELQKVTKTGRIGRYAKSVEGIVDNHAFFKTMENSRVYNNLKPKEKAFWWRNTVLVLERELGEEKAIKVMRTCGRKCCGQGERKTAKRLMDESSCLEEFLEKFIQYGGVDGELGYHIIDDNTFITRHNKCFCRKVRKSVELFENKTYCYCSVEFNKQFFQAAFNKPVDVTLNKSILNGDDCCEFEIKF